MPAPSRDPECAGRDIVRVLWRPVAHPERIGTGTDWLVYGLRDLATLLHGFDFRDFAAEPGKAHHRLMEHHQWRWLGDGAHRMVVVGMIDALWASIVKV